MTLSRYPIAALAILLGLLIFPGPVILSSSALAQCPTTQLTPAFTGGGSLFGRIASQWNSYFGSKVDANNGVLCNPTIIGGSAAVPNAPLLGGNGTVMLGVTLGTGLELTGQVLSSTLSSYERSSPVNAATVAASQGVKAVVLTPASELATLAVVLPPSPTDQQIFELSSTETLDDLTMSSSDGSTVSGAGPFVLAGNGGVSWRYVLAEDKWFRRN